MIFLNFADINFWSPDLANTFFNGKIVIKAQKRIKSINLNYKCESSRKAVDVFCFRHKIWWEVMTSRNYWASQKHCTCFWIYGDNSFSFIVETIFKKQTCYHVTLSLMLTQSSPILKSQKSSSSSSKNS